MPIQSFEYGRRITGLPLGSDPENTPLLLGQNYQYEFITPEFPGSEWLSNFIAEVHASIVGADVQWVGVEDYAYNNKIIVQLKMPDQQQVDAKISKMSLSEVRKYSLTKNGVYVSKKLAPYVSPLIGLLAIVIAGILGAIVLSAVLAFFGLLPPARMFAMFAIGGTVALITPGLWKILSAFPIGWGLLELGQMLSGMAAEAKWIMSMDVYAGLQVKTTATINNMSSESKNLMIELIHIDNVTGQEVDRTYDQFTNPRFQFTVSAGEAHKIQDLAEKTLFNWANEYRTVIRVVDASTNEVYAEKILDPSFII